MKKVNKNKYKKEDNWNILNKILNNISFDIIGKKNTIQNTNIKKRSNKKNKKFKKKLLDTKEKTEKKERHKWVTLCNIGIIDADKDIDEFIEKLAVKESQGIVKDDYSEKSEKSDENSEG